MAFTLKSSTAAVGASSWTLHQAGLQAASRSDFLLLQRQDGVRPRTLAHCQLASFSSYNSSSRSSCCTILASNSRNWPNKQLTWSGTFSNWTHLLRGPIYIRSSKQIKGVTSASLAGPTTVEVAANMFQLATAFVIPFYTVMILAPRWEWTKKMMESELTYFILGAGYIYLLSLSWTPETLGLMFSSKYWLPELSGIARMFTSTLSVASAWLHLLAADLFAGRQVYLDGLKHDVETRHSLVLCLMMCPIGIFSHLVTKNLVLFSRRTGKQDNVEITNDFRPYRT